MGVWEPYSVSNLDILSKFLVFLFYTYYAVGRDNARFQGVSDVSPPTPPPTPYAYLKVKVVCIIVPRWRRGYEVGK